jgi:hypothetical protein
MAVASGISDREKLSAQEIWDMENLPAQELWVRVQREDAFWDLVRALHAITFPKLERSAAPRRPTPRRRSPRARRVGRGGRRRAPPSSSSEGDEPPPSPGAAG